MFAQFFLLRRLAAGVTSGILYEKNVSKYYMFDAEIYYMMWGLETVNNGVEIGSKNFKNSIHPHKILHFSFKRL